MWGSYTKVVPFIRLKSAILNTNRSFWIYRGFCLNPDFQSTLSALARVRSLFSHTFLWNIRHLHACLLPCIPSTLCPTLILLKPALAVSCSKLQSPNLCWQTCVHKGAKEKNTERMSNMGRERGPLSDLMDVSDVNLKKKGEPPVVQICVSICVQINVFPPPPLPLLLKQKMQYKAAK